MGSSLYPVWINHLLCSIVFIIQVKAQTPVYQHYNVSDGLPGNIVYCAAQDENGLMWFGTDMGLACFDGGRFIVYGTGDGLPDTEILNLKLDSKGRMWISCFRKKPCYRYRGKIYTEQEDPNLAGINFNSGMCDFFEEEGRGVWIIGQTHHFFFYADSTNTVSAYNLNEASVLNIVKCRDELLAIEINVFLGFKNGTVLKEYAIDKKLDILTYQGSGCWGDYILLSSNTNSVIFKKTHDRLEKNNYINDFGGRVMVTPDSTFWLGSNTKGALRLQCRGTQWKRQIYLPDKKINTVFADNDSGIWFCTSGEGLYYLPKNYSIKYDKSDGLKSNNITSITKNGNIFLCGDDEGNIYKIGQSKPLLLASAGTSGMNRTRDILIDGEHILVATDHGIYRINDKKVPFLPLSGSSKYIYQKANSYFYGTATNVLRYDKAGNQADVIKKIRTTSISTDYQNNIWFGGIDGIYSLTDSLSMNWGDQYPALRTRITAMTPSDSGIWAVTAVDGLMKIHTSDGKIVKLVQMDTVLPLPLNNIFSMTPDAAGRLWLATNSGVYGLGARNQVIPVNNNNGLTENIVNVVYMSEDTLWAATVSGIYKIPVFQKNIDPHFVTIIPILKYKVDKKEFNINFINTNLIEKQQVTLGPDASSIEFGMGSLLYNYSGSPSFTCVIRKEIGAFRWLTLSNVYDLLFGQVKDSSIVEQNFYNFGVNLDPGRYHIQVAAINMGIESCIPAQLTITKRPHWYQTIWALLLFLSGIFLLAGSIFRAFLRNKKLSARVMELQLQAIKSQINPHFIGNSINAIQQFFYPPDAAKASKYIEVFTRLLRTTMVFSEKTFVTVEEELQFIEDYLTMVKLRFGDSFVFIITVSEKINKHCFFPTMIVQPLIENSTIHGLAANGMSRLLINMDMDDSGVISCQIIDNGIGIHQSKALKAHKSSQHISKGIALLYSKVATLNQLYHIDCSLTIEDISDTTPDGSGTVASIKYSEKKVPA